MAVAMVSALTVLMAAGSHWQQRRCLQMFVTTAVVGVGK